MYILSFQKKIFKMLILSNAVMVVKRKQNTLNIIKGVLFINTLNTFMNVNKLIIHVQLIKRAVTTRM